VTYFNELSILIGLLVGLVVGIRHLVKTGNVLQGVGLFFVTTIVSVIIVLITLIAISLLCISIAWMKKKIYGVGTSDTSSDQD